MRKAGFGRTWVRFERGSTAALGLILGLACLTSCGPDPAAHEQLNSGYRALSSGDYDQALAKAETYLRKTPTGPGSAEAFYLEGRVYEQKAQQAPPGDPTSAKVNLDAAATAYRRGLELPSPPSVQALLHAGVANIAYHYDDYGAAVREWQVSYAGMQSPDARAWVLYRIGVCQQRLGWFAQADRSFTMVVQQYPSSEPATRARSHLGAKGFYIQVGSFTDARNAARLATALKQQGFASEVAGEPNRQVVRVGPSPTYADARLMQLRLQGKYPGSVIVP